VRHAATSPNLYNDVRGEAYTGLWWGNLREGRPRRSREDNIEMYLQGVGLGSMEWIDLAQDRDRWRALVNVLMNQLDVTSY